MCLKTGNSRCFACVTVSYHVYKEIIKLNGVAFKPKPIKIEDAKIKLNTRSEQYKMSGNNSNAIIQKTINHQQSITAVTI